MLSIATLAYSESQVSQLQYTVTIPLRTAMSNPALVNAMHQQLNPGFLSGTNQGLLYYEPVVLSGNTFIIYGTYAEWRAFFGTIIPGHFRVGNQ